MLYGLALFLSVVCMRCDAFVPSRTIILPQVPAVRPQNIDLFNLSRSMKVKTDHNVRFMSDAAANIPDPENKTLMQKVCSLIHFPADSSHNDGNLNDTIFNSPY